MQGNLYTVYSLICKTVDLLKSVEFIQNGAKKEKLMSVAALHGENALVRCSNGRIVDSQADRKA